MSNAYLVGTLTVKSPGKWAEYRSKVPATLEPWGGEIVFRGNKVATFARESPHTDIVVVKFPDAQAMQGWFDSPAYQALIALREEAAEVVLLGYES